MFVFSEVAHKLYAQPLFSYIAHFERWYKSDNERSGVYDCGEDSNSKQDSGGKERWTVQSVDDIGQLLMKWDNGRALALIPGEDSFRRLTQEEIDRELQEQAQEQTISEQSM